jgi:hypothetical protein
MYSQVRHLASLLRMLFCREQLLMTRPARTLSTIIVIVASVVISGGARSTDAGAPGPQVIGPFAACIGVSSTTFVSASNLIKSEVCSNLSQLLSGAETTSQIGTDIQTLYTDLQTDFSLTPLCAASLMGVFVQSVITGQISAGSCSPETQVP